MITALEHDFVRITVGGAGRLTKLREELTRRGGVNPWSIVGFTEDRDGTYTIVFTREVPATPNTTPPTEMLSPEFEA